MATQQPLILIRNGFESAGGFGLGGLPIAFNVQQNQLAGVAVVGLVHEGAKRVTVNFEGTPGRVSFASQSFGQPMVEPWFPVPADTPFSFDARGLPQSGIAGIVAFYVAWDLAPVVPQRLVSAIAE